MCLSALHYINLVQQYTAVQTPTLSGGSINRGRKCISGGGVYPYIYIFCVTLKIAQPPPTNFLNCFFFSAAGRVQAPMYDSDASMDRSRRDVPKADVFVGCACLPGFGKKSALKFIPGDVPSLACFLYFSVTREIRIPLSPPYEFARESAVEKIVMGGVC